MYIIFLNLLFMQTPQPSLEEAIQVPMVLLDVAVYSKNGQAVTDLKLDDFVLKEDRRKMDILFFDKVQIMVPQESSDSKTDPPTITKIQSKMHVILVLDLMMLHPMKQIEALKTLEEALVHFQNDRTDMACYDFHRGWLVKPYLDVATNLRHLQDYRENLQQVRGRVDRLESGLLALEGDFETCVDYRSIEGRINCLNMTANSFIFQQEQHSRQVMAELRDLIQQEGTGPKKLSHLFFISNGFGLESIQSAHALARVYAQKAQGQGNIPERSPEDMALVHLRPKLEKDFRQLIDTCVRNRVIFHTFNPFQNSLSKHRQNDVAFASMSHGSVDRAYQNFESEMESGLLELADQTGGDLFRGSSLENNLIKALDRSRHYYLLGYRSPEGGSGEYRRIKLKVKRKRCEVLYRKGYYKK